MGFIRAIRAVTQSKRLNRLVAWVLLLSTVLLPGHWGLPRLWTQLHRIWEPSPAELFRLRAECANQARQFEANWRRDNGSDFEFLMFRNHYNPTLGRCFVDVYYGNPGLNMETVYDALEGINTRPLVLLIGGSDKAANESKEHRDLAAEIRRYMESGDKSK